MNRGPCPLVLPNNFELTIETLTPKLASTILDQSILNLLGMMQVRRLTRATEHAPKATGHGTSERQRSIRAFKLGERNHVDGVPRAAFEERAVGTFAGA